jgi:phage terminase large subunit-like protein
MKREIQVSRKTINSFVLLVVVLALIGGGFLFLRRDPALLSRIVARFEGATPTQLDPQSAPDAQVAVAALTAFYTLDYTEPVDQWQGRVCILTTADGCQLIQVLFAPAVRQVVDANHVKTNCTVQALRLVEDKGDTRTWLLEVTLDSPWPGENPTTQVYAEVTRINGTWLLNRILFDQEKARFATPALSAVETPTP